MCIIYTDGHLIYSLDDPYIHLAVAPNILAHGYGNNLHEYSAPSSSIIYPFLLAITEYIGLREWGPLVINTIATASSVYLVGRIIQKYILPNASNGIINTSLYFLLILSFCMATNSWGLAMTGLEHPLHVLFSLLVVWGFLGIIFNQNNNNTLLIISIAILPLIRFEAMAQSIISIMILFYLKNTRSAIISTLLLFFGLLSWVIFTHSLGLPVMPSSVQLKSEITSRATSKSGYSKILKAIIHNVKNSAHTRQGIALIFITTILSILSFIDLRKNKKIAIAIGFSGVFVGFAHICFGHFGWFSRYEIYALSTTLISCLILGKNFLENKKIRAMTIIILVIISTPYIKTTIKTPMASLNIYQQQYQMHRFVSEYWKKPVAVNDLGLVSYGNTEYVLDLFGLGSEEVRLLKKHDTYTAENLANLVNKKNIQFIMIYDTWFSQTRPASWIKVATLETSRVTAAESSVAFYVTPNADIEGMYLLLEDFRQTLPKGAKLEIYRAHKT